MAESITVTDNRTGQVVEIPITDGGVSADEFRKLLPGVWFYDPAFMTTALTSSSITYLDGDAGILRYRGYPIEQLAPESTYLEVAYLLIHGDLPTSEQLDAWTDEIRYHTYIHENFRKRFVDGFHYDAHPMGMLVLGIAALSTFYPEAKEIEDPAVRLDQIVRLIAQGTDAGGSVVPLQRGDAVRAPRQLADLHRELPLDDVEGGGAPLRGRSRPRPGARRALHPSRGPRAELRDSRHAHGGFSARRPLLRGGRCGRCPLRASPRRGQRGGPANARGDRLDRQCAGLHR